MTGNTAQSYDDTASLHSSTPVVFAFVIVLAFVLLLVAFRSVAIPLVSIGLNLLSVGAGYGLITLIFQDGRLQGLLGYTSFGGIISWIPLFMFVLLFGLSMDYHVFILSRIRELRSRGATTRDAIVGGISSSAGVVTSAAVIMVAVFSILATLPIVDTKTLGVGLAAAVFIDATVVRGILLPALMSLLGERCWYLPRWLSWLPGRGGPGWKDRAGRRLAARAEAGHRDRGGRRRRLPRSAGRDAALVDLAADQAAHGECHRDGDARPGRADAGPSAAVDGR